MGTWKHRLSNINRSDKTANCLSCGKVEVRRNWKGDNTYRCLNSVLSYGHGKRGTEMRRHKKIKESYLKCRECGVEHEDYRFFDVDHINSDHKNNNKENLQVLCPNCHRIKTLKLYDSWKLKQK